MNLPASAAKTRDTMSVSIPTVIWFGTKKGTLIYWGSDPCISMALTVAGVSGLRIRPVAYTVFVDDNYHYMDKEARTTHGKFETLEAAVDAAKRIVDDGLLHDYESGMSASILYARYTMFGDDPWVCGPGEVSSSAWEYAKARCEIMCVAAGDA